ncbi:hypothetical protein ATANTOWER_026318 [Ataeniobius toweri]|uniref:Uncharacterized protein n=1 Tax=Ataeniobius toweri TaxID=208326 RepID=A0ABU7ATH4_9TELE|nr:hypothetical protein [Ataeniobius toweri]
MSPGNHHTAGADVEECPHPHPYSQPDLKAVRERGRLRLSADTRKTEQRNVKLLCETCWTWKCWEPFGNLRVKVVVQCCGKD